MFRTFLPFTSIWLNLTERAMQLFENFLTNSARQAFCQCNPRGILERHFATLFPRRLLRLAQLASRPATARWGVVQLVGHLTVNEDGEGSNPSAPANFIAGVVLLKCPLLARHLHCASRDAMEATALPQILLYTSLSPHYPLPTCSFPLQPNRVVAESRPSSQSNTEDDAMKASIGLFSLVLAGAIFAAMPAAANQAPAEKKEAPATKKEAKWQGHVVRI